MYRFFLVRGAVFVPYDFQGMVTSCLPVWEHTGQIPGVGGSPAPLHSSCEDYRDPFEMPKIRDWPGLLFPPHLSMSKMYSMVGCSRLLGNYVPFLVALLVLVTMRFVFVCIFPILLLAR